MLGWMSARAFVTEMALIAGLMASYLRLRRGMSAMTSDRFYALMATDDDPAELHDLQRRAPADGVDLGWLY
ncbi:hypothetical protein NS228_23855 [Methylobacterium indicum]|nr:hypothetical protein NS229_18900 [Methylobacterium indicum]KTS30708.1 hypothetical protein NS228_23855 [Methylobacterium indicum]KTS52508.1 hypothetical protein NS230_09420 [Methylobacterium indicum]